jgi:hypothetical protein
MLSRCSVRRSRSWKRRQRIGTQPTSVHPPRTVESQTNAYQSRLLAPAKRAANPRYLIKVNRRMFPQPLADTGEIVRLREQVVVVLYCHCLFLSSPTATIIATKPEKDRLLCGDAVGFLSSARSILRPGVQRDCFLFDGLTRLIKIRGQLRTEQTSRPLQTRRLTIDHLDRNSENALARVLNLALIE